MKSRSRELHPSTVQSLPAAPRDLIALLPEPHRTFVRDACGPTYETLTFTAPQTSTTFDPTVVGGAVPCGSVSLGVSSVAPAGGSAKHANHGQVAGRHGRQLYRRSDPS